MDADLGRADLERRLRQAAKVTALDACDRARRAWEASQPQYTLDLWPDALNPAPAPEALGLPTGRWIEGEPERALRAEAGGAHLHPGLCSEGGDGPGGESAYVAHASLTAAATWHAHGGCAPPPSTETKQGEA